MLSDRGPILTTLFLRLHSAHLIYIIVDHVMLGELFSGVSFSVYILAKYALPNLLAIKPGIRKIFEYATTVFCIIKFHSRFLVSFKPFFSSVRKKCS